MLYFNLAKLFYFSRCTFERYRGKHNILSIYSRWTADLFCEESPYKFSPGILITFSVFFYEQLLFNSLCPLVHLFYFCASLPTITMFGRIFCLYYFRKLCYNWKNLFVCFVNHLIIYTMNIKSILFLSWSYLNESVFYWMNISFYWCYTFYKHNYHF